MTVLRATMLALLCVALPHAASAQETYTYYLHQESSDYWAGLFALKAAAPDSPASIQQFPLLGSNPVEATPHAGLPNTPNIKFLPRGTTFRFTLYMRKTGTSGVIYPQARMSLNFPNGLIIGGTEYSYSFCSRVGTSPLTTAFFPYEFECSSDNDILLGSLDRLLVTPGFSVSAPPGGNKTVYGEVAIEGTGNPSYPSRVVVTVPPNPRISSISPTVGAAGTLVTINGANFGSSGQVTFNGTPATPTSWTNTEIRVPAPTGNRALIRVTANSLASNPWTYVGVWDPGRCQPQLSSQRLGPVAAGGASINVAVTADPGCNWTVESVTPWLSVAPMSGSGSGTITVTVPGWTFADPRGGSFGVNGIPVGVAQNGTFYPGPYLVYSPRPTLTITGGQVRCSADADNSMSRTSLQAMDLYADGQLIASTWGGGDDYVLEIATWPAEFASSFYCVVFSVPDGYILAQNTIQNAGPHLISLNPSAGRVNSAVTLTGTGFGIGPGAVRFNGTPATPILWTPTKIYVTVPAGATSGPVVITDNQGQLSNAVQFTVRDLADPGGQLSYHHTDVIGSVRMITNPSGQIVSRYDYVPFGQDYPTAPVSDPNIINFAGKERDRETGAEGVPWSPLDYFGGRYYQGQTGRFTSVDPVFTWEENLVDPQRWNRYVYVRNNPFRYSDPDGRSLKLVTAAFKVAHAVYKGYDIYSTVEGVVDASSAIVSADSSATKRALGVVSLAAELSGASDLLKGGRTLLNIASDGVRAARQASRASGLSVLGKTADDYVGQAEKLGANYFFIPEKVTRRMTKEEIWEANKKFLDRAVKRRDKIKLATPIKRIEDATGWYRRELEYLYETYGLTPSEDGLYLVYH